MKSTHPTQRAILGIVAVLLIVIFSNWLMRSTPLGNRTLDLTEDKRHTLTDGTKAILSELDSPVIIRYYATRKSEAMPRRIKIYMRKVDDILNRYRNLSNGHIRIEHLDPQPDTDAEDSANLDGISGQRVNGENLYFGLSISCLDRQTAIPFLDPANETMLEYYLSSAIANVTTFEKTTIGLMTSLPLMGMPATQPGGKPTPPWIIYQLLHQRYNLQYLGMHPKELDPKKISVLLLIHPTRITAETEFLIDQYLLKGGIVIACLDPYALTAPLGSPVSAPTPKSSFLPTLLPAWGIGMDTTSVVADGKFASDFGEDRRLYAHLALSHEAIVSDDEIITRGFENLYFPLAGGFTINQHIPGIHIDTLVQSSKKVVLIDPAKASKPDPGLFSRRTPTGKPFGLVMRLRGTFSTAFPKGGPAKGNPKKADQTDQTKDSSDKPKNATPLKQSTSTGTVYLISDADFLFDVASFQKSGKGHVAINNNAALLENMLDQCTGSKHLIGSRSRTATVRPFTVVKEMETEFAQELREEVEKAKLSMESIVAQLKQLQEQKSNSKDLVLTPEQEAKIIELQDKQLQLRRELREKQKSLRARKDQLYSKITWLTIGVTPTFIALVGFCVWLVRRRSTRAK
jgi:ABC-type uncharacterized transport system involved in gliding motility auxiliary subunit